MSFLNDLHEKQDRYRIQHPLRYRIERVWWWVWRNCLSWTEWRWRRRRFVALFVRGWRGWAPHDVWNFNSYLAGVIAAGLTELAAHHHGYPPNFLPEWETRHDHTPEESATADAAWTAWLKDKAEWFQWYYLDEDGTSDDKGWIRNDLSEEEKSQRMTAYNTKMAQFHDEVLPDFVKHWGGLWD